MNTNTLAIVIGINIFLLGTVTLNLLRRKHIINFLLSFSVVGLILLEIGKLSLLFDLNFTDRTVGFGLCLVPLFWLIASVALLPSKGSLISRVVLSPFLGLLTIIFFIVWWIQPFIKGIALGVPGEVSLFARYFFVLVAFDFTLTLSNLERAVYYIRQKQMRLLFGSAFFLLVPYIILSAYAVITANLSPQLLIFSSFSTLLGSLMLMFNSQHDFSKQAANEGASVHTSVSLFLIGGYLFFVGAFIKLFATYGWNLNTLFSLLSTLFVLFAFLFIMFSSSFRERLGTFFLRTITRQKYDWQKIWEEFTYKISLVHEVGEVTAKIEEAIKNILGAWKVEVSVFNGDSPFEEDFSSWFLRYGAALSFDEFRDNESAHKYPLVYKFFKEKKAGLISPLYGEKAIIGVITISFKKRDMSSFDKELLKVLSLQASSVIVSLRFHQRITEAEKKASLYKVSSFIIHDIKNYINSLSLLLANKDKFNNRQFLDDALTTLESTVSKMQGMIGEFRALRGDITLDKQPHLLEKLVDEAIADVGRQRLREVKVDKEIDSSLEVSVDSRYLNRVFLNLIVNALDAIDNNGRIAIKSECNNGYAELLFEDNGCGMPKEFIDHKLFKPFYTTKDKGLGIGLYQCKTIIEAHGGAIEVESQAGQGTVFRVKLPLKDTGRKSQDTSHK